MVNGFSIHNTPEENSAALQTALDRGGEITIDEAGIYDISAMLLLSDNTMLRCAPGGDFQAAKMHRGDELLSGKSRHVYAGNES